MKNGLKDKLTEKMTGMRRIGKLGVLDRKEIVTLAWQLTMGPGPQKLDDDTLAQMDRDQESIFQKGLSVARSKFDHPGENEDIFVPYMHLDSLLGRDLNLEVFYSMKNDGLFISKKWEGHPDHAVDLLMQGFRVYGKGEGQEENGDPKEMARSVLSGLQSAAKGLRYSRLLNDVVEELREKVLADKDAVDTEGPKVKEMRKVLHKLIHETDPTACMMMLKGLVECNCELVKMSKGTLEGLIDPKDRDDFEAFKKKMENGESPECDAEHMRAAKDIANMLAGIDE